MNPSETIRIEPLHKENYDTWKIQMEALLIKNGAWNYVNGTLMKPVLITGDAASEIAVRNWIDADNKAKADIILSISVSELKQIKGCNTSQDVWLKLEGIYESQEPAQKPILIKQVIASFETARKSVADEAYEITDDDKLGRHRQHVQYNRYSNSEKEESQPLKYIGKKIQTNLNKVSDLPPCADELTLDDDKHNNAGISGKNVTDDTLFPSCAKRKKTSCTKSKEIPDVSHSMIFEGYVPLIEEVNDVQEQDMQEPRDEQEAQEMQENLNIKEYLKQIMCKQEKIIRMQEQLTRTQTAFNIMLQDIKQWTNRIEDVIKNRTPVLTETNYSLIAGFLPLCTVQAIRDFDSLLHDSDEAVTQFREFLLKIGGNNPRDNIHRTLSKIFTNECVINCSWKGVRNNFRISDLFFIKIMRREITLQHSTLTETEFDNTVAEWLRFGKQRKQREEKGKHVDPLNTEYKYFITYE